MGLFSNIYIIVCNVLDMYVASLLHRDMFDVFAYFIFLRHVVGRAFQPTL